MTAHGTSAAPRIAPGGTGSLVLGLPANWAGSDALRLTGTRALYFRFGS